MGDATSRLPRSYLYVPGTDTKRMAKALRVGTDAIILDLEDAVPAHLKDEARACARGFLDDLDRSAAQSPQMWVRVNSGDATATDLAAVRDSPALRGVILAKADLDGVRRVVDALAGSGVAVVPLLETAAAILDLARIAAAGVHRLEIGEYDLCADVAITPGPDEAETAWARAQVVFASRAAGLSAPVAPVSIEIRDTAAFEASTRLAARQGFVGRTCIHPAQVEVANRVFTPSPAEVDAARAIVREFAALEASAVMVDAEGRLVDEATLRSARRTLALVDEPPTD